MAGVVEEEVRRGPQLPHAREERPLAEAVLEGEVLLERIRVRLRDDPGLEKRLDLGGEEHPLAVLVDVERLLAEAVAGEEQPALAAVVDREREHPVRPLEHPDAVLRVEGEQHLGVRVRPERIAALEELGAELDVVVELAVVGDPELPVRRAQRLVAALDVDDRQAPVAETDVAEDLGAAIVGAAVRQHVRHPVEHARIDFRAPVL